MELIELLPGRLHLLRFGVGQAYLWQDPGSLTLIDTGPAGSGRSIAEAVEGLGYQVGDIRRVVLTHFHDDHAGAAAEVGDWAHAAMLAHRLDAPVIRGQVSGQPPQLTDAERDLYARIVIAGGIPPAPPARVDIELSDGDLVDFGGGAVVVGTPGHTDGSIAIYLPEHRLVFTGDSAARAPDGRVILGAFNIGRDRAVDSLRRLAQFDADVACFGHGDPLTGGASGPLQVAADRQP
jgi:glyoxylase-like metal-dependent hydrolase (beta-lactamase superfamily II)